MTNKRRLVIGINISVLLILAGLEYFLDYPVASLYFIPVFVLGLNLSLNSSIFISFLVSGISAFGQGLSTQRIGIVEIFSFGALFVSLAFCSWFSGTLGERRKGRLPEIKTGFYLKENSDNQYVNGIIDSYLEILEAKNASIREHSVKVANYARWIAKELKLPDDKVKEVYFAGLLHDLGKVVIPGGILNLPTNMLTDEDKTAYAKHCEIGSEAVVQIPGFFNIAKIIRHHHESCDGKGFPEGLKNSTIPLGSKIVAVANTYEKLLRDKAYLKEYGFAYALEELKSSYQTTLDSVVIEALSRAVNIQSGEVRIRRPA